MSKFMSLVKTYWYLVVIVIAGVVYYVWKKKK